MSKKSLLEIRLKNMIVKSGLPEPISEYKFCPDRRWRFDFAYPDRQIAIEIEGGIWIRGRHNRGKGMLKDMEKYNWATVNNWKILRYSTETLDKCLEDLTMLIF